MTTAVNDGRIFYYLGKPWDPETLNTVLAKATEHNRLLVERRHLIGQLRQANQDLELRVAERTQELENRNKELEEKNRLIEALARTDALTGLPNRRVWDETLPREIARAERTGACLSLMILDLDHFKGVNDTYGHPVGDAVLQAMAQVLKEEVRGYDLAARYGGEEFALLLPATDLPQAVEAAERLRAGVAALRIPTCPRALTVSIGVARFQPPEAGSDVLARADTALYQAKNGGRNRVVLVQS